MPRDKHLVAHELQELGWELPEPVLDNLALGLMPDEVILEALLGAGAYSVGGNFESYDGALLILTGWRVLFRGYGKWQLKASSELYWQAINAFSWFAVQERDKNIHQFTISPGPYTLNFRYVDSVISRERVVRFMNVAQRRMQAVKFLSALSFPFSVLSVAETLEHLVALKQQGHISEQEFEQAKQKVLYG